MGKQLQLHSDFQKSTSLEMSELYSSNESLASQSSIADSTGDSEYFFPQGWQMLSFYMVVF